MNIFYLGKDTTTTELAIRGPALGGAIHLDGCRVINFICGTLNGKECW